jgi:hypothetical protein
LGGDDPELSATPAEPEDDHGPPCVADANGRRNRTGDGRGRGAIASEVGRADAPSLELSSSAVCDPIERAVPPLAWTRRQALCRWRATGGRACLAASLLRQSLTARFLAPNPQRSCSVSRRRPGPGDMPGRQRRCHRDLSTTT